MFKISIFRIMSFDVIILVLLFGGRKMATSESQKRARDKWLNEKVEEVKFRVPKGRKAEIKEHADNQGESVNAFLTRAVAETIERDKK